VRSVSAVTGLPYSRFAAYYPFHIENRPAPPGPPEKVSVQSISPNYFQALSIPLVSGHLVNSDAQPQAVITQFMARRWWPGESPIGRRLRLKDDQNPWITIAGVVGDIPYSALDQSAHSVVYVPYTQFPERSTNLAIRTTGDPMALAPAVSAAIRAEDREQPVDNIATLEVLLRQETFGFRYLAMLMGAFGALALALATIGVYGVMSYAVSQQTHEIGIRLALGARRGGVMRMILRRGLLTALLGVLAGLLPAWGMARAAVFLFWGVNAHDSTVMVGVPLGLIAIAEIAVLIPARRAMLTDPISALREE